jgi:hypothetical protein
MSIGLNVRLEKVAGMLAIPSARAQQLKEGVVWLTDGKLSIKSIR